MVPTPPLPTPLRLLLKRSPGLVEVQVHQPSGGADAPNEPETYFPGRLCSMRGQHPAPIAFEGGCPLAGNTEGDLLRQGLRGSAACMSLAARALT
jgi:hypothetical protein